MKQTISWWEIQVTDVETAKKFYSEVFGWSFTPFDGESGYEVVHSGEEMVGGLHPAEGEVAGRRVAVVFSADERADVTLEDMLRAVEANGGTVITERTLIAEGMGWFASVADPSGLRFELSTDLPKG